MKKISIALCTHNGSRFLEDQLNSILQQTRKPDEMIVCDDCSSDLTSKILDNFSKNAPFPCKTIFNERNLKPTKNFEKAICHCTGDYIALSDQDDYWDPKKLQICEECLNNNEGLGAVFSNAHIVDSNMNYLGYTAWERFNFNNREQMAFKKGQSLEVLLKHYVVTGATMMFRTELRPYLVPIPKIWFHDAWIALIIASISSLSFVPAPLLYYRQHRNNHLGGIRKSLFRQILEVRNLDRCKILGLEIERYKQLNHRVSNLIGNRSSSVSQHLKEKVFHLERRFAMPSNRLLRIPFIAREFFHNGYKKYSRNWGSIAMDAFF